MTHPHHELFGFGDFCDARLYRYVPRIASEEPAQFISETGFCACGHHPARTIGQRVHHFKQRTHDV